MLTYPYLHICKIVVEIGGVNLLPEVGLYNGARGEIVDFNYGTRMAGPNNKHEDHLPAYTVVSKVAILH